MAAGLIGLIGAIVVAFLMFRRPPDIREFYAASQKWSAAGKLSEAETNRHAQRCLDVAQNYPGTEGGLSALLFVATNASNTAVGKQAHELLAAQLESAEMSLVAEAFRRGVMGNWRPLRNLAPLCLARARQNPDHPKAARFLAAVSVMTQPDSDGTPPAVYREAADLIADKYPSSPDICHFCESLRDGPAWAVPYERHLRAIVQSNPDRLIRCTAQFALANVVAADAEERQSEAEELFKQFLAEFDGTFRFAAQGIEQMYVREAQDRLVELRNRGTGKAAPEIVGLDLDDKPMKLGDFRGRVVLINFWATWCYPCMKLIPHEVKLAETFQGRPFEIVGVNCDTDIARARAAALRTGQSWRSFRNRVDGHPSITDEWKPFGYPCLYLTDHHGIIRKRWIGSPSVEDMTHVARVLVDSAERDVPLDAMKSVVDSFRLAAAPTAGADSEGTVESHPNSEFVEKVCQSADGSQSKYVVFVPKSYDGTKAFPAIVYLHGSGSRGTDGQLPLRHGLARAIRASRETFPFIAIFPQAREGESWMAESPGGKRALAILVQVHADYRIDPDRISLTGHSMGAQGTWSLAAAEPDRWAAIVPVSHGGDTTAAARLMEIPCWCFHGDADKMIQVQQSRDMVLAIEKAGGHPMYQEFSGADHDDAAARAYALPDLYEWMLLQNRSQR